MIDPAGKGICGKRISRCFFLPVFVVESAGEGIISFIKSEAEKDQKGKKKSRSFWKMG